MRKVFRALGALLLAISIGMGVIQNFVPASPVIAYSSGAHASGGTHASGGAHVSTGTHTSTSGVHTSTARSVTSTHTPATNPGARFGIASRSGGFTSSRTTTAPASRFGSTTTHNTTRSTPASRYGTNRTYTKSFATSPATRSRVLSSHENATLGIGRTTLGSSTSYTKFFTNPYSSRYYHRGMYTNTWYYSWMWNRHLTDDQHNILVTQGIDHDQLLKQSSTVHRVTISDHGTDKVIIVTAAQYNRIHIGDQVHLFDGQLTVNGEVIK